MKIKNFIGLLILCISFPCFAQNQLFKLSAKTEAVLIGAGAAVYGGYFVCNNLLNLDGEFSTDYVFSRNDVNAFDRNFMFPYSKTLDISATVVCGTVAASAGLLAFTPKSEWITLGTMYAETFMLAYGIKNFGKIAAGRVRPYMYFDNYPQDAVSSSDWNNSFPSAHTDFAFAAATFTSYTFCKYFPDNPWRFAVIGGTYAVAAATGLLRILSGNHFVTDVICGAAIGSACGFIVPYLHTLGLKTEADFTIGKANASLCFMPAGTFFSILF